MKVSNVSLINSSNQNFGARCSKSVERYIAEARKICPAKKMQDLEEAINIIKTSFPDAILTKSKKAFHIITEKIPQKGNTISDYKYISKHSHIFDDKVTSVIGIAATLDFMKIGKFSKFGEMVSGSIDGNKKAEFLKKWQKFFRELPATKTKA